MKHAFAILLLISTQITVAKTVFYGTETETISIVYGKPTILRFDEEVQTISQVSDYEIGPVDNQNPDFTTLSITPTKSRSLNDVTFILANGAVVTTEIRTLPRRTPEKTDSFYEFKAKKHIAESSVPAPGSELSEMQLMHAMIRGDQVAGYYVKRLYRRIKTGLRNIHGKLVYVYTGPKFNGYIFQLENRSRNKQYQIDLRSLSLGSPDSALLSQVDRRILKQRGTGQNKTFLRIVAKPASVYYTINLPVAPVQQK